MATESTRPKQTAVWYLPSPYDEGTVIVRAHDESQCADRRRRGEGCALHGPTQHWAVDLPLAFVGPYGERLQGGFRLPSGHMYRVCEHRVLHFDPDDHRYHLAHLGNLGEMSTPCPCSCCKDAEAPCPVYVPF